MFNLVLFILLNLGFKTIVKHSKPISMFLTSTAAKTELMDKYLVIQAMPEGKSKQKAYKQWQQECQRLELNLNPKLW